MKQNTSIYKISNLEELQQLIQLAADQLEEVQKTISSLKSFEIILELITTKDSAEKEVSTQPVLLDVKKLDFSQIGKEFRQRLQEENDDIHSKFQD
ncbi:hypothetical protein [Niallia circulans]|jgi:hypothetical protein|uniref:hypothetical protein n=1 Tax=Niallia circulans TaxID=1397 RepID=UPI00352563AB